MKKLIKVIFCYLLMNTSANAALALDRTRVIFKERSKIETIKIKNPVGKPFLAQSWLSDISGVEVNSEFAVIPPVMRIESNDYAILRIKSLPLAKNLPQDRESVYFLHVREVPPTQSSDSDKGEKNTGSIQIAIESVIKFFYRPN
ncbi:molecular chaperone, partial [Vibrio agarivorans]